MHKLPAWARLNFAFLLSISILTHSAQGSIIRDYTRKIFFKAIVPHVDSITGDANLSDHRQVLTDRSGSKFSGVIIDLLGKIVIRITYNLSTSSRLRVFRPRWSLRKLLI